MPRELVYKSDHPLSEPLLRCGGGRRPSAAQAALKNAQLSASHRRLVNIALLVFPVVSATALFTRSPALQRLVEGHVSTATKAACEPCRKTLLWSYPRSSILKHAHAKGFVQYRVYVIGAILSRVIRSTSSSTGTVPNILSSSWGEQRVF